MHLLSYALLLATLVVPSLAQVDLAGGSTNFGTSNIHYSIPVFSKPGFSYKIDVNSHVYVSNAIGRSGAQFFSGTSVQANAGFEWTIVAETAQTLPHGCLNVPATFYSQASIMEPNGTLHPLDPAFKWTTGQAGGTCDVLPPSGKMTTDGSGITVNLTSWTAPWVAIDKHGNSYVVSSVSDLQLPKFTDNYGNTTQIVYGGDDTWYYIDSLTTSNALGQTGAIIRLNNGSTWQNSLDMTYMDGSGTPRTVQINPTTSTISTDFGCPSVYESGGGGLNSQPPPSAITLPNGTQYTFTYESISSGTITGRVASVTNPSGGLTSYTYSDSLGHNGMDCARFVTPTLTVTEKDEVLHNTFGPWTYTNAAGTGAGSGGFAVVTETNAIDNGTTVTTYVGQDPNSTFGITWPPQGAFVSEVQILQGATQLTDTKVCYNTLSCGSAPSYPITQTDTYTQYNSSATNRVTKKFDSVYGNLLAVQNYDFGGTTPLTQKFFLYGQTYSGSTCTAYPSGSYVNDTPCFAYVEDGSNTVVAQTKYSYGPKGVMTLSSTYTGSVWLPTSFSYNTANGTLLTKKSPNGLVVTYGYSSACNGLLPTSMTNSVNGLSTSLTYDSGCFGGRSINSTGVAGDTTQVAYDDYFWRVTSKTNPNGVNTTTSYQDQYTPYEESITKFNSTISLKSIVATDSFGMPILSQKYNGTNWDSVASNADALHRVSVVLAPFGASQLQYGCTGTCPEATFTYDAAGRKLTYTSATGGTLSYQYKGKDVLTTLGPPPSGEVAKKIQTEYDGLGRITSTCALTSAGSGCGQSQAATGWVSTATYDALSHILQTTNGVQSHTSTYDQAGRVLTQTFPESGTTTFTYDSISASGCASNLGFLVKVSRQSGSSFCPIYDGLGREILKTYGGDANTDVVAYGYDMQSGDPNTNGNGRLTNAWTCQGGSGIYTCPIASAKTDVTFVYDNDGNILTENELTNNSWHTFSNTYDALDTPKSVSWINPVTITAWDAEGRATAVSGAATGGSIPLESGIVYGPWGPLSITYGNGDVMSTTYDAVGHITNKTLTEVVTCGSVACSDSRTTVWNADGTVQQVIDANNFGTSYGIPATNTVTNVYDALNQLYQTSSSQGDLTQQFTYDRYNNIQSVSNVGNTNNASPNMYTLGVNSSTNQLSTGVTYDANGRVLENEQDKIFVWDVEDHIVSMQGSPFTYDALGRMVMNGQGVIEWAPGSSSAIQPGIFGSVSAALTLPGGDDVSFQGGDTLFNNFNHKDYLGTTFMSTSLTTNPDNGQTYSWSQYGSFGLQYESTIICEACNPYNSNYYGFNGVDNAMYGSNDDYWLTPTRLSDGVAGRWFSPDPAHIGWNAYSFANNNPISITDRAGLDPGDGGTDPSADPTAAAGDIAGIDLTFGMAAAQNLSTSATASLSFSAAGDTGTADSAVSSVIDSLPLEGGDDSVLIKTPLPPSHSAGDTNISDSAQFILGSAGQLADPHNFLLGVVSFGLENAGLGNANRQGNNPMWVIGMIGGGEGEGPQNLGFEMYTQEWVRSRATTLAADPFPQMAQRTWSYNYVADSVGVHAGNGGDINPAYLGNMMNGAGLDPGWMAGDKALVETKFPMQLHFDFSEPIKNAQMGLFHENPDTGLFDRSIPMWYFPQ